MLLTERMPTEEPVKALMQAETGDLPESEAIRLAQRGDPSGFERVYWLHRRRVYGLCLRMAGTWADADDLTQEVFLQLFRKIHTFRGDSPFSTWLHRLSVNTVLMWFRKKPRREIAFDPVAQDDADDVPQREEGGPDVRLNGLIDRLLLRRLLAQLPPGYRDAFVLHDIQGYEHKEIAEIWGRSVGNSKSQLSKARARLRELLLEESPSNKGHERRFICNSPQYAWNEASKSCEEAIENA
jgi:RNA polymerase sigma-70 factor (ECF subfamily)